MSEETKGYAIVYSSEGCAACQSVIRALKDNRFKVTVLDAQASAKVDQDVWERLRANGGVLPLVLVNGEWANPAEILRMCMEED